MGSRRIPASRQTGERIEELLAGGGDHDVRSDLIRLGVRKLVEEVLEGEVEDRLGRAYYGRGDGERPGYRNGYRRGRLKSAEGAIEYAAPQVSDLGEPYRSRVRERLDVAAWVPPASGETRPARGQGGGRGVDPSVAPAVGASAAS